MKNIHILPTNKPSRLIKAYNNKLLLTNVDIQSLRDGYQFQSIYITSDEEIKEEFLTKKIYVIDIQNGNIGKLTCKNNFFKGSSKLIEIEWKNKQNIWNYCHIRQIILTTDQDLIKDSVQAIPDEFLEWFVKNPNCEFVEVTYDKDAFPYGVKTSKKYGWFKIIIPQEEPKQETVEEAAEKFRSNNPGTAQGGNNTKILNAFKAGAKSYAARDYWFEKFKKD
jgi:ABC-type sulfate/molybdate transport systems ATPase subunit